MTSNSEVKDVEFAKAPDFDACLAAVRAWKDSFPMMTYHDEEDCCLLTKQSFHEFLALGEDAGQVLHISLDNETGLVVSRSNSDISSGWEHVEIEDAQDAPEVEEGQTNLPADPPLTEDKRRPFANWFSLLRRESKISPAESPKQMEDENESENLKIPDADKKDLKDGDAGEAVEVKAKDPLERSCQVCRGLLRLHQPAPFAYWSCDGCGSRNLRKDAMWGCSHPDTCDWGLCTGCHPDKVLDTAFVSDFHAPLAGMLLTGLILCSASRFSSSM